MIFYQILSTNSLRKCTEIRLKKLCVDIILGLIAFKVFWFTFTFLPQPFATNKSLGVVFLYFVWIALTNLTKCTCPTENNKKRSTPKIWHKVHLNNYCGDYCRPPIVLWSGYCLDCKTVGFTSQIQFFMVPARDVHASVNGSVSLV